MRPDASTLGKYDFTTVSTYQNSCNGTVPFVSLSCSRHLTVNGYYAGTSSSTNVGAYIGATNQYAPYWSRLNYLVIPLTIFTGAVAIVALANPDDPAYSPTWRYGATAVAVSAFLLIYILEFGARRSMYKTGRAVLDTQIRTIVDQREANAAANQHQQPPTGYHGGGPVMFMLPPGAPMPQGAMIYNAQQAPPAGQAVVSVNPVAEWAAPRAGAR